MQTSRPLHLHRSKPPRVHTKSVYVRTKSAFLPRCAQHRVWQTLRQIHHRLVTIILKWSLGSIACTIPILRFEQYRSTEATIGFVLRIVATFARFFSFMILASSSRTCSRTQKVSRISVFSLLYCFQLIRHQVLHSSSIQCCPDLN